MKRAKDIVSGKYFYTYDLYIDSYDITNWRISIRRSTKGEIIMGLSNADNPFTRGIEAPISASELALLSVFKLPEVGKTIDIESSKEMLLKALKHVLKACNKLESDSESNGQPIPLVYIDNMRIQAELDFIRFYNSAVNYYERATNTAPSEFADFSVETGFGIEVANKGKNMVVLTNIETTNRTITLTADQATSLLETLRLIVQHINS